VLIGEAGIALLAFMILPKAHWTGVYNSK